MDVLVILSDFWEQVYLSLPIIDKFSAMEVGIPNRAARRAFDEIRMERNQKLLCRVCGLKPILHVCDEDEDGCDKFDCISRDSGYFYDAQWNICPDCKTYHFICMGCNQYCNLTYHGGWFVKKNPKKLKDDIKVVTPGQTQYKLSDESKLNYISNMVVFPTGPDGGECHEWVCKNKDCPEYNSEFCFSDQ